MAVVGSAHEHWKGRSASFNGGIWTYRRQWLVKTDDKTDREDTVSGASGLPAYAELHPAPISDAAYCTEIEYKQLSKTPLAWTVIATYTSGREFNTGGGSGSNTDATQDGVLVSWTSEIYQEAIFQDVSGDAIVNSAGDYLIDPSPTRDASHLVAKIRANVASVPAWVLSYQNAVNNASVTIGGLAIASGLAKVQRIEIGELQNRNNSTFYPLSFEVHVHENGWRLKPLDAGFRERDGSDDLIQILNEGDNNEPTTPVPLDGSGAALDDPTPSTAVFLDFQVYEEKDLTTLPGIS